MAITNGYATLTELKNVLGRDLTDTVKDTFLEACIERASRIIDDYTRQIFYDKTITNEKIDRYSVSTSFFSLSDDCLYSHAPIISVTSLVEDGVSLVADTDFYLYENHIQSVNSWTTERKGLVFTGHIGYTSVPKPINEVCLAFAEVLSGIGIKTVTDGTGSVFELSKDKLPVWAFDVLSKWRSPDV
jgi:hypothetical protein